MPHVPDEDYLDRTEWEELRSAVRKLKDASDLSITDFDLGELKALNQVRGD